MKRRTFLTSTLVLVLALSILLGQSLFSSAQMSPISGAIFTTDETGLLVDGNIYANALDVYLSGGPGPNAPPTAAGLPDGEYYFQVTDPPGKKLLSTDDIEERRFKVEGGVITQYLGTTHAWNDISSEIPNAITIQLWPFGKTPNKGGVYKAWATPVDKYDPTDPHSFWGFIPKYSKTDNYKVRKVKPLTILTIDKFNDANGNGTFDEGEELITGWRIDVTHPNGVTTIHYTPVTLDVTGLPGEYIITEEIQGGWEQTALILDGAYQPVSDTVTVWIENGEKHNIIYGNHRKTLPRLRILIGLGISPTGKISVGTDVTFDWIIIEVPADVTDPQKVTLEIVGITPPLYEGSTFPDDLTGMTTWTAGAPGDYTVKVTYEYMYLGKGPYFATAAHTFTVVANGG